MLLDNLLYKHTYKQVRIMKIYIAILIATVSFSSCKLDSVTPATSQTTTSLLDISGLATAPMFNSKGSNDQIVKTTITGNTLKYVYTEHVDMLVDVNRYRSAWYVYFKEDFGNSELANMDFTTLLQWGVISKNYVPENLNQVVTTVTDTVINKTQLVSVHFSRDFNFEQHFDSPAKANAHADSLSKITQQIKFTTRYMPVGKVDTSSAVSYNLKFVR